MEEVVPADGSVPVETVAADVVADVTFMPRDRRALELPMQLSKAGVLVQRQERREASSKSTPRHACSIIGLVGGSSSSMIVRAEIGCSGCGIRVHGGSACQVSVTCVRGLGMGPNIFVQVWRSTFSWIYDHWGC
jgi:hypothetical protein